MRVEAGQPAGLDGPPERARDDAREVTAGEPSSEPLRLLASRFGKRDVGRAGVLATDRPLGLAMPNEHDLGTSLGHARTLPDHPTSRSAGRSADSRW
jgi:hypothetical protein